MIGISYPEKYEDELCFLDVSDLQCIGESDRF